jgi:recombination protein RecR
MIKKQDTIMKPLANMIQEVSNSAKECLNCGNISEQETCKICISERRSTGEICVVEDVADLWAMERTKIFKGKYHVLGGTLSALDAVGPEELGIPKLIKRVVSEDISEVILALNSTMDGQTTAHYIADQLGNYAITISSLAQGVPIGGELDYLDDGTISAALIARKSLN